MTERNIIDEIDALVDAQLEQEASGYDRNINECERAAAHGVTTLNVEEIDDLPEAVRELTGGRARSRSSTPSAWRRTARPSAASRT